MKDFGVGEARSGKRWSPFSDRVLSVSPGRGTHVSIASGEFLASRSAGHADDAARQDSRAHRSPNRPRTGDRSMAVERADEEDLRNPAAAQPVEERKEFQAESHSGGFFISISPCESQPQQCLVQVSSRAEAADSALDGEKASPSENMIIELPSSIMRRFAGYRVPRCQRAQAR